MVRVMRAVAVAERARATRRARAVILEERADVEGLAARGGWYILNRAREKIVLWHTHRPYMRPVRGR